MLDTNFSLLTGDSPPSHIHFLILDAKELPLSRTLTVVAKAKIPDLFCHLKNQTAAHLPLKTPCTLLDVVKSFPVALDDDLQPVLAFGLQR